MFFLKKRQGRIIVMLKCDNEFLDKKIYSTIGISLEIDIHIGAEVEFF